MFKKTLLALAVVGFTGNVMAAASTGTAGGVLGTAAGEHLISAEGAFGSTSVAVPGVTVTIGTTNVALYSSIGSVTIDVAGGTLTPSTSLTAGNTDVANLLTAGTVTYPTLTQANLLIGGADRTTLGAAPVASNDTFTFGGLNVAPAGGLWTAGDAITLTVKFLSTVGGAVIETVVIPATVVKTQYGFTAIATDDLAGYTGGEAVSVDTADGRMSLAGASNSKVKVDAVEVNVTSAQVDLLGADASAYSLTSTLNADFNFMDDDADFAVETGNSVASTGTTTYGADLLSVKDVTATASAMDGSGAHAEVATYTITVDGTRLLTTQAFTVDSVLEYDTALAAKKSVTYAAKAAGSWSLNGSSDDIAFLPFGTDYAQSITVTNTGSVSGEVTIDLTAGGTTYTTTLTGMAVAKTVTNISAEVAAFALASGIDGDARIKVVVNAPSASIKVKGLYYHKPSQDRVLTY
jgi:hypothetical protein